MDEGIDIINGFGAGQVGAVVWWGGEQSLETTVPWEGMQQHLIIIVVVIFRRDAVFRWFRFRQLLAYGGANGKRGGGMRRIRSR